MFSGEIDLRNNTKITIDNLLNVVDLFKRENNLKIESIFDLDNGFNGLINFRNISTRNIVKININGKQTSMIIRCYDDFEQFSQYYESLKNIIDENFVIEQTPHLIE